MDKPASHTPHNVQDDPRKNIMIENEQIACKIDIKTSSMDNRFPAKNLLSTLPPKHGGVVESNQFMDTFDLTEERFEEDDDDDKLLIVDENFSGADGELINKNIAED
jgi:hypothetical protein